MYSKARRSGTRGVTIIAALTIALLLAVTATTLGFLQPRDEGSYAASNEQSQSLETAEVNAPLAAADDSYAISDTPSEAPHALDQTAASNIALGGGTVDAAPPLGQTQEIQQCTKGQDILVEEKEDSKTKKVTPKVTPKDVCSADGTGGTLLPGAPAWGEKQGRCYVAGTNLFSNKETWKGLIKYCIKKPSNSDSSSASSPQPLESGSSSNKNDTCAFLDCASNKPLDLKDLRAKAATAYVAEGKLTKEELMQLPGMDSDVLNKVFEEERKGVDEALKNGKKQSDDLGKQIDELAKNCGDPSCGVKIQALSAQKKAIDENNARLTEQSARLAAAQKALTPGDVPCTGGGPRCDPGGTPAGPGSGDPTNPNYGPTNPSTFGGGQGGGGGGQGMGQGGGQGGGGGQGQGQRCENKYVCMNSTDASGKQVGTLYYQTGEGSNGGSGSNNSGGSNNGGGSFIQSLIGSFFGLNSNANSNSGSGGGGSNASQCALKAVQQCQYGCANDQQNGNGSCATKNECAPAPTKPDPTLCTTGTWTEDKNNDDGTNPNKCVVGWKCTTDPGSDAPVADISCQPLSADVGMTISISYSCTPDDAKTITSKGDGYSTEGKLSGSTTAVVPVPSAGATNQTYTITCAKGNDKVSKQCSVEVSREPIVMVAVPSIVKMGETATIGWVTSMRSCVISSPDQDDFTNSNKDNSSPNGGATSAPITKNQTTFYLTCETPNGLTRTASTTIRIMQ